jgi:DNA-binding NtrC family response regulator
VPVVLCDNSLPDAKGIELLAEFRAIVPEVQMIMITGMGTIDIAVLAMKAGFFDFITKPVDPEHLVQLTLKARELYDVYTEKKALQDDVERMTEQYFIGKHSSIQGLLRLVHTVAPRDSTVLIEGESGTGKELVARLVHMKSRRSSGPFVAVDSGAIPEGLVESELFGHEKGSFTGALSSRVGKFERANGGTLFLDEITNLNIASQDDHREGRGAKADTCQY